MSSGAGSTYCTVSSTSSNRHYCNTDNFRPGSSWNYRKNHHDTFTRVIPNAHGKTMKGTVSVGVWATIKYTLQYQTRSDGAWTTAWSWQKWGYDSTSFTVSAGSSARWRWHTRCDSDCHNNYQDELVLDFCMDWTKAPTKRPTKKPTKRPTTKKPTKRPTTKNPTTKNPTKQPTGTPTRDPKTCDQLGWGATQATYGHPFVCGESDHGALTCSGEISHSKAQEHCEAVGARLCTIDEIARDETRATGCGYDRTLVWSSSSCGNGKFWAQAGNSLYATGSTGKRCMSAGSKINTRCCADQSYDPCADVTLDKEKPDAWGRMRSAARNKQALDITELGLKSSTCAMQYIRRMRKNTLRAARTQVKSLVGANEEVEVDVDIEEARMPAGFLARARARGKTNMKTRRARAKNVAKSAGGAEQCAEADIDFAVEGAYDIDLENGDVATACRAQRPLTRLSKESDGSYKRSCWEGNAWGSEVTVNEGDEYQCGGETFYVESLAAVADGETVAPTSAPTTAEFHAYQLSDQALEDVEWTSNVIDDVFYKCHRFDTKGCFMNEPSDRSTFVRTQICPCADAEPVRAVSDGTFTSTEEGTTFTSSDGLTEYFSPYECECKA